MKFNDLIKVYEDFYAPIDTKEPVLKSKGKCKIQQINVF